MEHTASASPRRLARIAGLPYLVNILTGAFAIGVVPALLIVPGDVAATARGIQSHELLYRLSLVAHLVTTLTNVPLAVVFYDLFKVVNRRVALMVVFFTLIGTTIEAAGLRDQFAPLVLLGNGPYAGALQPAQLQALAYLPHAMAGIGYSLDQVFFGLYGICMSYLVLRSTFLPRAIGVLVALAGLSYLLYSTADLLAPGFAARLVPWVQLPSLLGEGSLCVWFLAVGLDVERWRERARTALGAGPAAAEAVA